MSATFATSASSVRDFPKFGLVSSRIRLDGSKCRMMRRNFVSGGIAFSVCCSLLTADPVQGMDRLPFRSNGYNFWTWKGRKIHYVEQGMGRPVVLIHGFGASAFHWSLGGFAALMTAAESAQHVRGVVLLNSAGQFENPSEQPKNNEEETVLQKFVFNTLKEFIQRIILGFLFWQAKQPARVEKVLKSVYINASNVDNYLVESITKPAEDPNAGEVYYRLMTRFMSNQSKYTLNSVLSKLSCPLLLIWGDLDPWVGPAKAARIKEFYPNTTVVNLQAGHCPHDEVPELVNEALLNWLSSL
ncbi:pheophytinase, chloroplastic-like isoform X2 [Musa acuminata AAA Group]|uniref:pheophytinase, chloroplastic-like isoform X2 n=1 Tax=Musa acuminata AAA Group TaxID=214697 RepID=UPI0031D4C4E8